MTYVAGLLQPYPELVPVLSLARSTVTEAFGLGDDDTDVILACERLGAEAMIAEYSPLLALISTSDTTVGAELVSGQGQVEEAFADKVTTIAATLHRRCQVFQAWLEATPSAGTEAGVAARLLSQAAASSFELARDARGMVDTSGGPGPSLSSPSTGRTATTAQRVALGVCYNLAIDVMTSGTHRALVSSGQDR